MEQIRLDRLLSEAAGIPRAEARKLILKGFVQVNEEQVRSIDKKVENTVALRCKGVLLYHQQQVYIMLNKPKGVVSARMDGRDKTVVDLVKAEFPRRELFPAGRLDKDSTGFVLLTDDGIFAHEILAPRHHVSKTYEVVIDTVLTPQMIAGFEAGVCLADGSKMKPADLFAVPGATNHARVVLHQGVYHQIKRMF
ncbi:MAG: RNA pseudouridine synthase, partial [Pygmaiobacter sp.]